MLLLHNHFLQLYFTRTKTSNAYGDHICMRIAHVQMAKIC